MARKTHQPPPLSERMRAARHRLRLTQRELADLLDVHPMTVSRWERGQLDPSPLVVQLISHTIPPLERDDAAAVRRHLHRAWKLTPPAPIAILDAWRVIWRAIIRHG